MSEPITTGDLITGRFYRITLIAPSDPDPSLKVGDVVECAENRPNCIDPECMIGDGMEVEWFADYDAENEAYRTLVNGVEEVERPS